MSTQDFIIREASTITIEGDASNVQIRALPGTELKVIHADPQKIDLTCVVGTSIPMLFYGKERAELAKAHLWHKGRLRHIAISGNWPFQLGSTCEYYSECKFDASENNWVSWNPYLERYKPSCPLPEGVNYQVILFDRSTVGNDYDDSFHWDWEDPQKHLAVIAFRVTGLAPGWEY